MTAPKKRIGQPPKPPEKVASERILARVTVAEKAAYVAAGGSKWLRPELRKMAKRRKPNE